MSLDAHELNGQWVNHTLICQWSLTLHQVSYPPALMIHHPMDSSRKLLQAVQVRFILHTTPQLSTDLHQYGDEYKRDSFPVIVPTCLCRNKKGAGSEMHPALFLGLLLWTCQSANCQAGGSVVEWLERWTCNSKAPSSTPALTASWICLR